jgi:hypothetical protein
MGKPISAKTVSLWESAKFWLPENRFLELEVDKRKTRFEVRNVIMYYVLYWLIKTV